MPRAPDGTYSLPSGTIVSTGDTILTSQHNPPFQDVAAALTASLDRDGLGGMRAPLAMGGNPITGLEAGVNPTDAATVGQLSTGSGTPIGTVIDFAGSTVPAGWLVCAGQSINRADYADLFAVIGTTYGSLSGSTFSLPDCRGRTSAGRDLDQGGLAARLTAPTFANPTTLGAVGGSQTQALTIAQLASHTHTGSTSSAGDHNHTAPSQNGTLVNNGAAQAVLLDTIGTTSTNGAHTHTMNLDSTGSGEAHPNVQPTILFNKLIRAV